MNVQKRNDVTIYNLSSGPALPEWLGERARRNLAKRDDMIRRRIELIQDFQMPSSANKVVQSGDGRYVIVGGTYPPRIRCFDLHDLTMKFERYLDSQVMDIVMLGEDYGKIGILMDDRTIGFHAHYGKHEAIRIPKFGRSMTYEPTTCELLVAASGDQIYRLNLEEGRFTEPWAMDVGVSAACIAVSPSQPLASVGCDDGIVRFWDNRSPDTLLKPFLKLDVQSATAGYGFADENSLFHKNPNEISSIAHDSSGLYMAAGTAGGLVALYDVRTSKPLHVMEHKHGAPIHTIKFHSGSACILSSDEKLVKIWKYKSSGEIVRTSAAMLEDQNNGSSVGSVVANVEGTGKFANFIMAGDEKDPTGETSGVLLCATDQPKLETYYIPKVGLAPKWCSFLENITEELEERDLKRDSAAGGDVLVREGEETVFENYKFVSRDDLESLGVSDLVGTPMLKAYMHGFFMDISLYNRIRAVANPFEYEDYRKKKLKERLDAKRASRIAPKESRKKKTAVNTEFADRLQDKAGASKTKAAKLAGQILSDNRFGNMFTNPDYEIDEEDEDFKLRNPSGVAAKKGTKRDDMDSDDDDSDADMADTGVFRRVDDELDDDEDSNDSDSDDSDDGFRGGKVRGEAYDQVKAMNKQLRQQKKDRKNKNKKVIMYEADDLGDANDAAVHAGLGQKSASMKVKEKIRRMNMPLDKRFRMEEEEEKLVKVVNKGGAKEITYIPKDSKAKKREEKQEEESDEEPYSRSKRQRRSMKGLR
ncbi:unnamed protein product [Cylindrotheca closterium]|uniref:NUC153 domain-containing protein n=1 Tax=Cylindrotheca closterium TaxID=2856 RepID=A0AAD2JKG5_9STRA|nr:unnamed protein product [Cylindrotheca closterium]